jgi:hypothetical protein
METTDRIVTNAQYPLASWFAPTMYVFWTGLFGVVFGSLLIAAARAFHWNVNLRIEGSAAVVLLSIIAAWAAHRLVRDSRSLKTDQQGLIMSVGGRLRRVGWSEIKGVTRIENGATVFFRLETDTVPVAVYPQRYRDSEGLLRVILANLSPTVVWRDG